MIPVPSYVGRAAVCLLALCPLSVLAAPVPTGVVQVFSPADGISEGSLSLSDDRMVVAGVDTAGDVFVLDMSTWTLVEDAASCSSNSHALDISAGDSGGYTVLVGCAGGMVESWSYEDGAITKNSGEWDIETDGDVVRLHDFGEGWLAMVDTDPVTAVLLDSVASVLDTVELSGTWSDSVVSGDEVYVVFADGSSALLGESGDRLEVEAFADPVVDAITAGVDGVYLASADGLYRQESDGSSLLDAAWTSLDSFAVTLDDDDSAEEYLLIDDGGQAEVYSLPYDGTSLGSFELTYGGSSLSTNDMVAGPAGYVLGVTDDSMALVTANPFVSNFTISPTSGQTDDEMTVSFELSGAGTWAVYVDGTETSPDSGDLLVEGEATEAGYVTETFTIPADLDVGVHEVWVVLSSDDLTGAAQASFTVTAASFYCDKFDCDEGCGGSGCATGSGSGGAAWLGLLTLGALGRRRRMTTLLGAAMILPALTLSSVADAQEARGLARFDRDTTRAWSNFEIRYTSFQFDEGLQANYGERGNGVFFSGGPQIFRFLEVDFGIGFTTKRGLSTNVDGSDTSGQVERLRFVPLSVGLTLRAHVIDEQPVVPYGSIGGDWVYWRQDTLVGDTTTPFGSVEASNPYIGSKGGWHWEVGGQILLDWLSPRRASILEASTGINDTWLVIAFRRQNIGGGEPALSGGALHIGLQLDY